MTPTTETQYRVFIRWNTKLDKGEFDPPLPSRAERRRIREAAGPTQRYVADELDVSRHLVCRWEKPVGYAGDRRLPPTVL